MKVLCTGGCGFIGSNLVDELIKLGYQVDIVDNLSTGDIKNLNEEAVFYMDDITKDSFWYKIRSEAYDYVFHTAALARIQPSIEHPVKSHEVNVNGTLKVLEYCRANNSKLIFSGSSSVFSGEDIPANEDSKRYARNPYSLNKLINEQYIDLYRDLYDLNAVTLRYFSVYGERQLLQGAYRTVIGIFIDQKKIGEPLYITGDGEQRRDFTYVGDVVKANIMAMDWEGTYNIGSGKNYSINEIAELFNHPIEYIDKTPGEVRETLADNSKAQLEGWHPSMDVKEWLDGK